MIHWEGHYVPPDRIHGDEVDFPPEEVRHLAAVLRRKKGDRVWAVDGLGGAHEVELIRISGKAAVGKILRTERNVGESSVSVTLAAGVLKGERFDWLVEKAVELGVSRIVPFTSASSSVRSFGPNRAGRWRKVALAAMKQCGRSVLPEVLAIRKLDDVLTESGKYNARLVAHPDGEAVVPAIRAMEGLRGALNRQSRTVLLAVGPEGGLGPEEIERMKALGFECVSLGPRRLRSETAAAALLAALMMTVELQRTVLSDTVKGSTT